MKESSLTKNNRNLSAQGSLRESGEQTKSKGTAEESALRKPKDYPSARIQDIMKKNNEILSKYECTPSRNEYSQAESNSLSSIRENLRADESKDVSSREYFSNNDISPVKNKEYESSLETVRSEEESARLLRQNGAPFLLASEEKESIASRYRSPGPTYSNYNSPTVESIQMEKRENVAIAESFPNIGNYSQTVESLEESESKLPNFRRPPNMGAGQRKNSKSSSRKKESVIKVNGSDSFQRSVLSGIPSEGSRERSSMRANETSESNPSRTDSQGRRSLRVNNNVNDSIDVNTMNNVDEINNVKELNNANELNNVNASNNVNYPNNVNDESADRLSKMESLHFDSNVYESEYDRTVAAESRRQSEHSSSMQNDFKSAVKKQNEWENEKAVEVPKFSKKGVAEVTEVTAIETRQTSAPKIKSLEEARKIAKEFRMRSAAEENRSAVEEKLSELESFVAHKKDESLSVVSKVGAEDTTSKKKDILRMLEDLEDEDYEADFDSYKEQSER